MQSAPTRLRRLPLLLAFSALILLPGGGAARAASDVYPPGGGSFTGSAQGWSTIAASCNVPLCSASGGHDAAVGNPPGSLGARTNVSLGLLSLFESTVVFRSPTFTVSDSGPASLHVERAFAPGELVSLAPQLTYVVTVHDFSNGTESRVLTETVTGTAPFLGKDAAATLVGGHAYAISIEATTTSTVVGAGVLGGTAVASFDNARLSLPRDDGDGDGGGAGGKAGDGRGGGGAAAGVANRRLYFLVRQTMPRRAVLKGRRLIVRLRCPRVRRACRITAQGMLRKRRAATNRRRVRIGKRRRARRVVLRVRPRFRRKVAKRKRLVFRQRVKVGKRRATVYRRLRLIRRR